MISLPSFMRKNRLLSFTSFIVPYYLLTLLFAQIIFASDTSNFSQVINAGTLSVDIADSTSSYSTVASPSISMGAVTFSFSCQQATGTFGTAAEAIYVVNPDAADGGWNVTLAASDTTDVWDSAGTDYDFNDPGSAGCVDDGATTDVDNFGGQMTVDPSGASLSVGDCSGCTTTNVTLGSSDAYVEGTTNEITVVTGAAGSDDIGDWDVQGVSVSQQIPSEQPAASDYNIDMTLSII